MGIFDVIRKVGKELNLITHCLGCQIVDTDGVLQV